MNKGYNFYFKIGSDVLTFPITPGELSIKSGSNNEVINLINEGDINILKSPSLTEIEFEARFPMRQYPYARAYSDFKAYFDTFKELKEKVLGLIKKEFVDMETNISEEELGKVKEFMVKSAIEAKEKNNSWLNNIVGFELNGVDTFNQAIETINAITVADVQKFMKEFNAQNNYRVVVLDPAK